MSENDEETPESAPNTSRPMPTVDTDDTVTKTSVNITTSVFSNHSRRADEGQSASARLSAIEATLNITTPNFSNYLDVNNRPDASRLPILLITRPSSFDGTDCNAENTDAMRAARVLSTFRQLKLNLLSLYKDTSKPQPLLLLALAKLNESSISLHVLNRITSEVPRLLQRSPELATPDSLLSAPPSYSFVIRQRAARRRPRLMGAFISSPSFVLHAPPPHYAAEYDIYLDNPIQMTSPRVNNFGFTPMPVICPECGFGGLTVITSKVTLCTHLCAVILCLMCCWVCVPLPYVLRSCKDVYHHCRNCRSFLGVYCPTNPENTYAR